MLYSERAKLAEEYEEWVNKPLKDGSKIKDCPLSVITFMMLQGFIPPKKGLVVLSKEEHQKYCAYKIIEPQIRGCLDRERELERKLKELEEQRDRQAYIAEELIQEKHRWTEQARKETAKKLAEQLKESLDISVIGYSTSEVIRNVEDTIDNVAKQFGVEVEE